MASDLPAWVADLAERLAADGVEEALLYRVGAVCPDGHECPHTAPSEVEHGIGCVEIVALDGEPIYCEKRLAWGRIAPCDLRKPEVFWPVWAAWAPGRVFQLILLPRDGYVIAEMLSGATGTAVPVPPMQARGPTEAVARATAVALGGSVDG